MLQSSPLSKPLQMTAFRVASFGSPTAMNCANQAVESWRQVWASEGLQETQLRISRLWAGQPAPLPSDRLHVVVATIQTLSSKIHNQPDSYSFLKDFKVLVFDEAHRSVAPTFTLGHGRA